MPRMEDPASPSVPPQGQPDSSHSRSTSLPQPSPVRPACWSQLLPGLLRCPLSASGLRSQRKCPFQTPTWAPSSLASALTVQLMSFRALGRPSLHAPPGGSSWLQPLHCVSATPEHPGVDHTAGICPAHAPCAQQGRTVSAYSPPSLWDRAASGS